MDFLSSPQAFGAWLVETGLTEVIKYFFIALMIAVSRPIRAGIKNLLKQLVTVLKGPTEPRACKSSRIDRLSGVELVNRRENRGLIRRSVRGNLLRHKRWIRKYRFDEVWINREASRGHACFMVMLLWFGIWVMAIGLKEVFQLSDGPLSSNPGTAFAAAMPIYLFELAWLRFSGRAGQLISYRNKVKIWRWITGRKLLSY